MSTTLAADIVAWLATFALHATILVAIAALATRRLAERAPARAERIWTVALWAGLMTASVQVRTRFGPSWTLATWTETPAIAASATFATPHELASNTAVVATECVGTAASIATAEAPTPNAVAEPFAGSPEWIVALWIIGAALGLVVLSLRYVAFLRSLRDRRELDGPIRRELTDLAHTAGVALPRLTVSPSLAAPASFMLPRPEICVPERVLTELDPAARQAILAHELAHLVRRDPLHLLVFRALEAVFFFQPLLRVARQRLVGLSETLCDEWAVERTGGRRELARTLAHVAAWVSGARAERAAPVARMAACRSSLGRRVERLLRPVPRGAARTPTTLAALGLVAVAITGPGVACQASGASAGGVASSGAAADGRVELRALELLAAFAAELDVLSAEMAVLIDQVEQKGQAEPAQRLRDLDWRLRALRGRRDQLEAMLSRMVTTPETHRSSPPGGSYE